MAKKVDWMGRGVVIHMFHTQVLTRISLVLLIALIGIMAMSSSSMTHQCHFCSSSYKFKNFLMKHIAKEHPTSSNAAATERGGRISCHICSVR